MSSSTRKAVEAMKVMEGFIADLLTKPESMPFREPVDWRSMGLFDYPKRIKRPMDLGTVKMGIERGDYLTAAEVVADVRLVFVNCQNFNAEGTELYARAVACSRRFEERIARIEQLLRDAAAEEASRVAASSDGTAPASEAEKQRLKERLLTSQMSVRADIVARLDVRCPNAISLAENSADDVLIDLDAVDGRTFRDIEAILRGEAWAQGDGGKGGNGKKPKAN